MTTFTSKKRKLDQIEVDETKDISSETVSRSKKVKTVNSNPKQSDLQISNGNGHANGNKEHTNGGSDDTSEGAWGSLKVSKETRQAIDELNFDRMTEIQYKAIPQVLEGHDLAGAAKTGSGKTLAFVIPAIELLAKLNWTAEMGVGVLVIAPTRELAIQIQVVAQKIVKYHKFLRVGLVIGGNSRHMEAKLLKSGCPFLVATPGRLMDHIQDTYFTYSNLKMLVIDEADHILDIGFERQMNSILEALPTDRQTLLFSATLNEKTKSLVAKSFRNRPVFVKAEGQEQGPTADKLVQMYSVIPQDKKLVSLLAWLREHKHEKVLIFFSTKYGTQFYESLFHKLGISVMALYGAMAQNQRTKTFFQFVEAKSGILLATNVASRGLDFPAVHWIIQFDAPEDPKEYIHRVGRTARAGLKGEAVIFLQESELEYLNILRDCNLELKKIEIPVENPDEIQKKVEEVVEGNHYLKRMSIDGCKAFYRGYRQRAATIFHNSGIDLAQTAKSFGLAEPPVVRDYGGRGRRGGGFGGDRVFGSRGRGRGRGRGGSRGGRGGYQAGEAQASF